MPTEIHRTNLLRVSTASRCAQGKMQGHPGVMGARVVIAFCFGSLCLWSGALQCRLGFTKKEYQTS